MKLQAPSSPVIAIKNYTNKSKIISHSDFQTLSFCGQVIHQSSQSDVCSDVGSVLPQRMLLIDGSCYVSMVAVLRNVSE